MSNTGLKFTQLIFLSQKAQQNKSRVGIQGQVTNLGLLVELLVLGSSFLVPWYLKSLEAHMNLERLEG